MADPLPDYYRVVQVHPEADFDVMQAAYRVLARRLHPDLTGDDEAMKRLNEAWEVLQDPTRRRLYDQARAAGVSEVSVSAPPIVPAAGRFVADHAGPPPGDPFGPVVTFGRYEGWTIGEIGRIDREFLEWLRGVPAGRGLRDAIESVLRRYASATGSETRFADGRLPEHRDLFRR
jgi:curved DNA-binding protein CbpA